MLRSVIGETTPMRISLLALLLTLSSCAFQRDSKKSGAAENNTVILIGVDGFRPDYIQTIRPPNISRLAEMGVQAKEGMIPVFPTKTFPNFYSIATGLYPQNHGIIANTMYDPKTDSWFRISDRNAVEDPMWWEGEPIWVTAEKQGIVTATYFFVGSETAINGVHPTYWNPFDAGVPGADRVDKVLEWLDLPEDKRPGLIAFYFEHVDSVGHTFGTQSDQNEQTVLEVDAYIGQLLEGLEQRGISDEVNLIVVSDHGMSDRSRERVFALDDYLDLAEVQVIDTSPVLMMNAKHGNAEQIVARLKGAHPQLEVWLRDDVPEKYHFTDHYRIPEIIGQVGDGWTMYRTREYMIEHVSRLGGATHGFAPDALSMRSLFVAHGPAFKNGFQIPPFENIHLYALMAEILGIEPVHTDGSLEVLSPALRD